MYDVIFVYVLKVIIIVYIDLYMYVRSVGGY